MQMSELLPWSVEQSRAWYRDLSWLCGFNYVPGTAINSTEMWKAETFDPETIDRELNWAEQIGFNTCRVFLQYLVWRDDPTGYLERINHFLSIADSHHISTVLCLFDGCVFADKQLYLGTQDEATSDMHDSDWRPDSDYLCVSDRQAWPQLQEYVTAIIARFAEDPRVLAWDLWDFRDFQDLYKEPANKQMEEESLPLLRETFHWARSSQPSQPLTTCIWNDDLISLNEATLELSDIITFHQYEDAETLERQIASFRQYKRPIVCTAWFARERKSLLETHLPIFRREQVGCYLWGLVNGKAQTPLSRSQPEEVPEPGTWQHDLLRADGSFYREEERETLNAHLCS